MIKIFGNNTICNWVKPFIPESWKQTAILVGIAAGSAYFLKTQYFPDKGVRFSGKDEIIPVEKETSSPEFPAGYAVTIPGNEEPQIVILENSTPQGVTIRFQDDKENIEPQDHLFLDTAVWKSWKGKKIW